MTEYEQYVERESEREQTELAVRNLCKHYSVKAGNFSMASGILKAVDDVSLFVEKGETFGLIGESGCGKTTFGKTVLNLIKPTSGSIIFEGQDLSVLRKEDLRKTRTRMQIIFQDPYASLNPRMTVGGMLEEPLKEHGIGDRSQRRERVLELLEMVGLRPFHAQRYPHEFSGGQRQRIVIARALTLNPRFIVCDEPVSALDVSVQSQILNLLTQLKNRLGFTYLFISHDWSVVRHMSDRIGVMYLGNLVEIAPEDELYRNRLHPYTEALLSAMPVAKIQEKKERQVLTGELPSPINPPSGCHFHTRCPFCRDSCLTMKPQLREAGKDHWVACHLRESNSGKER